MNVPKLIAVALVMAGCPKPQAAAPTAAAHKSTSAIPVPKDVAAPPPDAIVTASGLAYIILHLGKSEKRPIETDKVRVHYSGWTTDGVMFDSSVERGETATLPLNRVIKGWTEGLQLMTEQDKFRFWIPGHLAYGDQAGRPNGTLVFDVELFEVVEVKQVAPVPKNVTAPAEGATFTPFGLAYIVLEQGEGTEHPSVESNVTVHYTGWTTDGVQFDSSIPYGDPPTFPLSAVIEGWQEAVPLMVAGDSYRFWIPEDLAYKGAQGPPQGMLVFDLELIGFH